MAKVSYGLLCLLLCSANAARTRPKASLHTQPALTASKVNQSGHNGHSDCGKTAKQGDSHQTYMAWLQDPPCEATKEADSLVARADELARKLDSETLENIGDADVVVAGSSYLDRYFVGFNMILSRANGKHVNVKRFSGASSGANAPFDMLLMGERPALTKFLTYGLLGDRFNYVYYAGVANQSYWFEAIDWMFEKYGADAPKLNDKMYVWTKCTGHCSWWGSCDSRMVISKFNDPKVAALAYRATGSVFPSVDIDDEHKKCTDGGVGSVFSDGQHAQITVSPTKALGMWRAMTGYTLKEYSDGVKAGQDAAAEFLRSHKTSTSAVVLCAAGSQCKDPSLS